MEWSDWYAREDPTAWVLPQILRAAAERHPDREYLRYGDGPWVGYGEVNARANRVANGLLARGVAAGRVGERAAAQLRGVRPGLVRHPQGRRGHEPDQHRLQGRLPQLDDQPGRVAFPVHRRHLPRPAGAGRVRAAPAGARGRAAHGRRPRPRAVAALGDPGRADGGPRRRARRHRLLLDRRRPDHVHLGHHRPLQGRHQAERRRLLLGAQRGRGDGRRARRAPPPTWPARPTSRACRCSTPTPRCCAPTRRCSRARGWPTSSASRAPASGSRRSTPAPRPSTASARSSTSSGTSRPRRSTARTRCTRSPPRRPPRTSTTRSRSASACG